MSNPSDLKPWWKQASSVARSKKASSGEGIPSGKPSGGRSSGGMQQMCLDVGQRGFARVTCPTCGMTYMPGDTSDEQLHKLHHNAATARLRFQGWSTERCVSREADGRTLLVLPGDPLAHINKVQQLCTLVEEATGWQQGWLSTLASSIDVAARAPGSHPPHSTPPHQLFLLHVSPGKGLVGMLVVDRINTAWQLTAAQQASLAACHTGQATQPQRSTRDSAGSRHLTSSTSSATCVPQVTAPPAGGGGTALGLLGQQEQEAAQHHVIACHEGSGEISQVGKRGRQTGPPDDQRSIKNLKLQADAVGLQAGVENDADAQAARCAGQAGGGSPSKFVGASGARVALCAPGSSGVQYEGAQGVGRAAGLQDPQKVVGQQAQQGVQLGRSQMGGPGLSQQVLFGVRAVWVSESSRQQDLPARLVNLARCHTVSGYVVPADRIAWSMTGLMDLHAYKAASGGLMMKGAGAPQDGTSQHTLLVYDV